jgi:effector-binding domain-containing protein
MHTTLSQDPVVVERPAVTFVGTRRTVTMDTIGLIADRIGELVELVLAAGRVPADAPFLRYEVIDMDRALVVTAGVPVDGAVPLPDGGDVWTGTLPAGRYVTVVHHGHPDELLGATADLLAWTADQGLVFDVSRTPEGERWGARLENFLTNPVEVPELNDWDTELAFRIAD